MRTQDTIGRLAATLEALTPREREVLALMADGLSNSGIATRMYLSTKTIEVHVTSIFDKLGLISHATANRRVLAAVTWLEILAVGRDRSR